MKDETVLKGENKIHIDDAILLSNDFSKLVNTSDMSDVTFLVGVGLDAQEIHAHRIILASRSSVFAAMLFNGLRESTEKNITVPNIRPQVFLSMLEYIYAGKTSISTETAVELLGASNQYDIANLELKCAAHIQQALAVETVCTILVQTQGFSDIFTVCMDFIDTNASAVFHSQGFLDLPEPTIVELVKRDHLSIQEIDLFEAILR